MASPVAASAKEPRTYIAIDVGTTNSGYGYTVGATSSDYLIQPGKDRKEPTMLLLKRDKEESLAAFGADAWKKYETRDLDDFYYFDRFKMELQQDSKVHGGMTIKAENAEKHVSLKLLFTRVFEHYHKESKDTICRTLGIKEGSDEWTQFDEEVRWVLTVPAIWGDSAKQFIVEAAVDAGLVKTQAEAQDNIIVALEPEGAALACRDDLLEAARNLSGGDLLSQTLRYMVVDCGGGTVDVTVHDLDRKSMTIAEIHQPTGGAWGGTCVDDKVKKMIEGIIGDEIAKTLTTDDWLEFMRVNVQDAKEKMDGDTQPVSLNLTHAFIKAVEDAGESVAHLFRGINGMKYNGKKGYIVMESHVLSKCFEEPLKSITDHVVGLLREVGDIQCVLVAGGFAESPLLINHLCSQIDQTKCRVIRPKNPSSAILKGALMYGQNPERITTRVSKYTYGIEVIKDFVEDKHPQRLKMVIDGKEQCDKVFKEIICKGDRVKVGAVMTRKYRRASDEDTHVCMKVVRSDEKHPEYTTDACLLKDWQVKLSDDPSKVIILQLDFSGTRIHFKTWEEGSDRAAKEDDVEFHSK